MFSSIWDERDVSISAWWQCIEPTINSSIAIYPPQQFKAKPFQGFIM